MFNFIKNLFKNNKELVLGDLILTPWQEECINYFTKDRYVRRCKIYNPGSHSAVIIFKAADEKWFIHNNIFYVDFFDELNKYQPYFNQEICVNKSIKEVKQIVDNFLIKMSKLEAFV